MSAEHVTRFKQILTDNHYHLTRPRQITFNMLLNDEPQSMAELLQRAKGQIDRVSVYRTIELFEKLGIVQRINVGWKYKLELSDQFQAHHHHLSCLSCGTTIAIEDEQHIERFISEVTKKFSFSPSRHHFEIDGYCSQCRPA